MSIGIDRLTASPVVVARDEGDSTVTLVGEGTPLPVSLFGLRRGNVARAAYSGTVSANGEMPLQGGAVGSTPTVAGAAGARVILVALQHKMSSGSQAGNLLRVRRRYLAGDGTPWTVWTSFQDFSFDSGSSEGTSVFLVGFRDSGTTPIADEFEIVVKNSSTTTSLVWQAVVLTITD